MILIVAAFALFDLLFFVVLTLLFRSSLRRAHRDIKCLSTSNAELWAENMELTASMELLQAAVEGVLISE